MSEMGMKTQKNKGLLTVLVIIVAFVVLLAAIFLLGRFLATAEIILNGSDTMIQDYGHPWEEPGATAEYKFPYIDVFNKKEPASVSGTVNPLQIGDQVITYSFNHWGKNVQVERHVTVADISAPEIKLVTDPEYYTKPNEEYIEEGFTATDLHDGDLTEQVERTVTKEKVIYTVSDAAGNKATVEREIPFDDRTAPVIELGHDEDMTWVLGIPFTDSYKATDDVDGDITSKVTVESNLDVNTIGDYVIKYTVSDSYNNITTAERHIKIIPKSDSNGHYVYLTFDDGPYKYTQALLDLLDKYDAKATFFVTGWYGYPEMIAEEAKRGHSVGVHTYNHMYDEIYSSDEAFWADIDKIQNLVIEQTGKRTNLMRFAGGSSNRISASYSEGIMTRLVEQTKEKGYTYFDWNVSSGDAGITTDPKEVAQYIIEGMENHENAVVLCHDIKEHTLLAMEDVLIYGIQNGYTFLPLTENSPTAHHGVNN